MNIDVTELSYMIHQNAKDKGFWDENNGVNFYIKQMAMIHSEVSETLEALRKEKGDQAAFFPKNQSPNRKNLLKIVRPVNSMRYL